MIKERDAEPVVTVVWSSRRVVRFNCRTGAIDADGTLCERFGSLIELAETNNNGNMFAKALEFYVRWRVKAIFHTIESKGCLNSSGRISFVNLFLDIMNGILYSAYLEHD